MVGRNRGWGCATQPILVTISWRQQIWSSMCLIFVHQSCCPKWKAQDWTIEGVLIASMSIWIEAHADLGIILAARWTLCGCSGNAVGTLAFSLEPWWRVTHVITSSSPSLSFTVFVIYHADWIHHYEDLRAAWSCESGDCVDRWV